MSTKQKIVGSVLGVATGLAIVGATQAVTGSSDATLAVAIVGAAITGPAAVIASVKNKKNK